MPSNNKKNISDSRERMSRAQWLARVGDWERDLVTNELIWSDEMFRLLDVPQKARVSYEAFLENVHPDDRNKVINMAASAVQEGKPYSSEYRVKHRDGTMLYIRATADVVRDENGRPIRLIGTAQDITEQKLAENALKESEQFTMDVIDSLVSHIAVLDANGVIVTVNEPWKRFACENKSCTITTSDVGKNYLSVCDVTAVAGIQSVLRGERDRFTMEYTCHAPNEKRWFMMNVTKLKNSRLVAVVSHTNITKLKQTEELLKDARALAEKSNQVKDEFLSMVSHELRTPLTAILTWAQMLRMGTLDPKQSKHGIEVIERSANAQRQLIDDLLDISRIQSGKLHLNIEEIDPAKVIIASIDSMRGLASSKSIQIEVSIDPLVKNISADPTRLQQILWNLISNAIKFSPKEGRVWITLDRVRSASEEQIRIQVRDNGKGIKAEFLPNVFKRFYQVDSTSTRAYGGLGLGLTIVQNLAEMHGGSVAVDSSGEGLGSTFTVLFPARQPLQNKVVEVENKGEVDLHDLRILLVEDVGDAREVFSVMLQSLGAEVRSAESVSAALTILENFKPDVLVSDIAMPIEDGYGLIKKIRELKSELKNLPAIAVTAYAGVDDIQRMYFAGFQSHLAKPVDSKKLALEIARLIKKAPISI